MPTYRTSLAFARLRDAQLNSFTENVVLKMTGNPAFPTPVVSLTALESARSTFANAISAAMQGSKQATAAKNAARETLLGMLRQQAAYVQSLAGEDLTKMLSSGFEAASTNRTQVALTKPVLLRVDNPQSTKLGVTVQPVPTARAYELRLSYGVSGWQAVGVFTYSRPILIENLTPGTTYSLQARAVGGVTGYSDWSDPVSHMAM
ncbi:MAG TPA: fibronectin type III domain-containing protein [Candidatus Limnocylindria bacterium]|nr:fibronectin type III domain-containing protein [Candidatus Limnocylindria bacterium]